MILRTDQRAAHYQDQADKLRELADLEAVPEMSVQLRGLAQECQELADNLKQPVQGDTAARGSADSMAALDRMAPGASPDGDIP